MNSILRIMAGVLVTLALLTAPAFAQTTVNSTSLAVAINASQQQIQLASVTNIAVNDIAYVNNEAMIVRSISSPYITVTRGSQSTNATAHSIGATVWTGAQVRFYTDRPVPGKCTRANELYLPHIVPARGEIWDCSTGSDTWTMINGNAPAVVVTCKALLIADMVDQTCFIADRNYTLVKIQEIHKVAESAGTLTLIPRRMQGTEAAASGDALATAIDMVGAGAVAQTLKTATLTTTTTYLNIEAGNRLGLDFTDDVAGELADVTVSFVLIPQ